MIGLLGMIGLWLDQSTFYGGDAHGYTDYPRLEEVAA